MIHLQTLSDYYTAELPLLQPGDQRSGGHFSVYRMEDFITDAAVSGVYSRKDFYKIVLTTGNATYQYADRQEVLAPGQAALVFTNTQVPYSWDIHQMPCRGFSCAFTEDFLPAHTHLRPANWAIFAPDGPSFFRLSPAQATHFGAIFEKMLTEQESDYPHKYDLLYHYLMECIHGALKLEPTDVLPGVTAATRLTASFMNLLARQFPIVSLERPVELRTAQAFADALAVHVNYLNRVLKTTTGKTTTQWVAERLVQEARALLLHTNWSIGQIGYCLGFGEPTHFTQFFRRYARSTPSALRHPAP